MWRSATYYGMLVAGMAANLTKSDARINVRVRPDIKERIEKAAVLSGKSVTEFTITALADRANDVLKSHETTTLGNRDRDIFLRLLDKTAKPNAALRRAASTHKRLLVK